MSMQRVLFGPLCVASYSWKRLPAGKKNTAGEEQSERARERERARARKHLVVQKRQQWCTASFAIPLAFSPGAFWQPQRANRNITSIQVSKNRPFSAIFAFIIGGTEKDCSVEHHLQRTFCSNVHNGENKNINPPIQARTFANNPYIRLNIRPSTAVTMNTINVVLLQWDASKRNENKRIMEIGHKTTNTSEIKPSWSGGMQRVKMLGVAFFRRFPWWRGSC